VTVPVDWAVAGAVVGRALGTLPAACGALAAGCWLAPPCTRVRKSATRSARKKLASDKEKSYSAQIQLTLPLPFALRGTCIRPDFSHGILDQLPLAHLKLNDSVLDRVVDNKADDSALAGLAETVDAVNGLVLD